ncbi:MAG TPA: hypothetical protein PKD09_23540 [Aggregatilinea sp.]|uniref:hypothetical protein n=1 Tax=Aggregatilinea sp. TaxID=2806333 RepID=UPI002C79DCB8|nr:hypothetical protein [Aggregatilinea sp.]HML24647.1 hypothetical protein [Aggregatilinea sp.]
MNITCPTCGAGIPAANINIHERLAVCPQCSTVFPFDAPAPRKAKPRKVKQPDFVTVREQDGEMDLSFRWRHMMRPIDRTLLSVFTLIALTPVLSAVVALATTTTPQSEDWIAGVILTLLSVAMMYLVVVALVDRLHIHVGGDTVRTGFAPLPIWTRSSVDLNDIAEVRVETSPSRRRQTSQSYYNVQAICHDGREITLATVHYDLAQYIAGTLNDYLGDLDAGDVALDLPVGNDWDGEIADDGELRLADDIAQQVQRGGRIS